MTTLAEPEARIDIDDRGRARVAGTRAKVSAIVIDHVHNGLSAEEIAQAYPYLSLVQIHAALSFYFEHQAEIDREIESGRIQAEALRREWDSPEYRDRIRTLKRRFAQAARGEP